MTALSVTGWTSQSGRRLPGHLILAAIGGIAFVLLRPPVADLQAATARASAAGRHVGLGYWFSWFGGSAPGQYSVLSPLISSLLGVTTVAALSVVGMAALAGPLLRHTSRPRSGRYLLVGCALCDLWSGRVAFSLGLAVSLAGLLLLLNHRPWLGGGVNALAALLSPLAPCFILLLLVGPVLTQQAWRTTIARFAGVSAIGLAVPALLFGAPPAMPFSAATLAWSLIILLPVALLDIPRALRIGLLVAAITCVGAFLIPSGVGANISRFCYLVLPPLVCASARNRARMIALALVPALTYGGYVVTEDLASAATPAAQQSYYAGLRTALATLPGRDNHRAEVIDTATHRAATELVPTVYLARGWETQLDATDNALLYDSTLLTATTYRGWLDANAVAWVAVPTDPGRAYLAEAALTASDLNYLHLIWQDTHWRLFAVTRPRPILPAPATVVSATETEIVFDVPGPATLTLRLRPSRWLRVGAAGTAAGTAAGIGAGSAMGTAAGPATGTAPSTSEPAPPQCLASPDGKELTVTVAAAGRYTVGAGAQSDQVSTHC